MSRANFNEKLQFSNVPQNTQTIISWDCPGICWRFCLCVFLFPKREWAQKTHKWAASIRHLMWKPSATSNRQIWPEMITSRDAKSTCFEAFSSRMSCDVIIWGIFGAGFGSKTFTSRDGCFPNKQHLTATQSQHQNASVYTPRQNYFIDNSLGVIYVMAGTSLHIFYVATPKINSPEFFHVTGSPINSGSPSVLSSWRAMDYMKLM